MNYIIFLSFFFVTRLQAVVGRTLLVAEWNLVLGKLKKLLAIIKF